MTEEPLIPNELPEQLLEQQEDEETESESFEEASEELGEDFPDEGDDKDPLEEQAKAAWEEVDDDEVSPQGGVSVGLSPLGPVVQVVSPTGDVAQKVVSVEELFLLGGQMIGVASVIMNMSMQAQMEQQARIQQMMEQGEEQTKSGLYVKRH
jgi:hypothetical protein